METKLATDAPKRTSRKGIPNHPIEFRRHLAKLACEPGVSVARLAMDHGVNPNLVFKWRRALRAGEYDPVDLLPVTVEAPAQEMEQPTPAPVASAAPAGAIEICVGNTRVRIEGSPHEATLLLVLRMLRGASGPTA
ncbi:IS66-like element accessory protein TnpA [Burkholderia ubonensis]|uniref:IS66-like element accessory protein TnpA n=1 Tax=Burkholderia ubonensis TaxID=101571 RepID=UPI000752718D|nr:transposase [Burkholderia ubonensis]AOI68723.1 DNA-binding protein [Burkholderia ubonensis]KUZ17404.1 DNA-binding protein [Burkholderia ubonensis]KUZ31180.1 DNA-binding protein [Burkholderia ubonensis]KUZ37952.1 DNA-binding protein [Burkholderia ubonensis]KUZ39952.1 DNA-binding protein [Burkholderia ubonensis]